MGLTQVNMRSRVKAMSSSSENWRTANMRRRPSAVWVPSAIPAAAKADDFGEAIAAHFGALRLLRADSVLKSCPSRSVLPPSVEVLDTAAELCSAGQPRAAVPTYVLLAPKSMISSARAKMPGLLGTTRRLCGESQRNQRDHCRRRGSTGRSRPCRARESATSRVRASKSLVFLNYSF
jgi:hypothetical protein